MTSTDKDLVELFVSPLRECAGYQPHFGNNSKKEGFSLSDFLELYNSDPFYSWIGLDSPYLYSAHKAAGSMTSLYRQIGIGCERLFRQMIILQPNGLMKPQPNQAKEKFYHLMPDLRLPTSEMRR